ncbi:MAG TPA: SDR family NAD(P)-dependent oxidoreductase [Kofleriaceae bacterium]|jgi:NAD(P)-dependent dehydrogenase (short-subunit alcohol dehydrogenase family)
MSVWIVTGCSRGLGRAIAEAVLGAGHQLVATARSTTDLAYLPASDRLRTVALDVTDAAQARAAVELARTAFGRVDALVNNAGYIHANSVEDMQTDEFRAQFEVDFFGVYNMAHAVLPVMHAQRSGWICSVSSVGGRRATSGLSAYQAAKHAVGGFSEVLATEVAPLGIRVTCLEPAGMRTDMFSASMLAKNIAPDYEQTVKAPIEKFFGNPANAHIDIHKFAQVILRLADDPHPPVRLLIGKDAVRAGALAIAARTEEDAKWKTVSESTDE